MAYHCEVVTCNSRHEPGVTYHRFPADPLKRQEWRKLLGIKEAKLKTTSGVCSHHFRPKDYLERGERRRLHSNVVPTLKLNVRNESKASKISNNKKSFEVRKKVSGLNKCPIEQVKQSQLSSGRKPVKNSISPNKYEKNVVKNGKDKSHEKSNVTIKTNKKQAKKRFPASTFANKVGKNLDSKRKVDSQGMQHNDSNVSSVKSTPRSMQNIKTRRLDNLSKSFELPATRKNRATNSLGNNLSKRKATDSGLLQEALSIAHCKMQRVGVADLSPIKSKTDYLIENKGKPCKGKPNVNNFSSDNINNIQHTIKEMQNKINKLEQKSLLDEKRIETFRKALIEQREKDVKLLMEEKENELLLRMDLLYLDYDAKRICRLCLHTVDKTESLIPLFWPIRNESLITLIKNVTGIQVASEDGMPLGICNDCLEQIQRVDWIRKRTQRSNVLLKKLLAMKRDSNDNPRAGFTNEKTQFSNGLFEEELSDAFKIEDVFSLENSSEDSIFANVCVKQESGEDDTCSSTHSTMVSAYSSSQSSEILKLIECKKCHCSFTNQWSFKSHVNYCCRKFQCSECTKCFWNSRLLYEHKRRRYSCLSEKRYRTCYECQTLFRWKWQNMFHLLVHDREPCRLCDSVFYSEAQLKHHFTNVHALS